MTYEEFVKLPASEKVTLVTLEAKKLYKVIPFAFIAPFTYQRDVDQFVSGVTVNGVKLIEVFSLDELTSGAMDRFFFDIFKMRLYVKGYNSTSPADSETIITHKFFFASTPQKLPSTLVSGNAVVEWDGRLLPVGGFGQQLDDENSGIVVESKTTLSFINSDGYFDEIFDTLIWENQDVKVYVWSPKIPLSEKSLRFDGKIESKAFASDKISFKVNDSIYKLRKNVALGEYSDLDGRVQDSNIGKAKKRIYGRADKVRCVGVSQVLSGIPGKGTITYTYDPENDSKTILGSGTSFLSDLSPGDELSFVFDKYEDKFSIESIESDGSATISKAFEYSFANIPYTHTPSTPLRTKNRKWNLSGHKIASPQTTILKVLANNRFEVENASDMYAGDRVLINGVFVTIRRVSGSEVVTQNAVIIEPEHDHTIYKLPVQDVYFGQKKLGYGRDWGYENGSECNILLTEVAEREIHEPKNLGRPVTFTAGSREVTTTSVVDFRSILKPRDWIRPDTISNTSWYEILDVDEQKITLRIPFGGTGITSQALIKQVEYVTDDSLITASCLGKMDKTGKWIKTISEAVKDLLINDAGFDSVNNQAFDTAVADCDFMPSMVLPLSGSSSSQPIRDVITALNNSVFGSLFGDKASKLSYSVLNSEKPDDIMRISDDDILSFSVATNQKIINSVKVNFAPFTDLVAESETFRSISFKGDFVDKYMGIENDAEVTSYLYNPADAQIIAERTLFFRSLSTSTVTLKGNLYLSLLNVNDKVSLFLRRLYKRFGSSERAKIGIVSSVKTDGTGVSVEVNDLGNIFNRVPSIASDSAPDIEAAEDYDKLRHGYVVDNRYLTPQVLNEEMLGSNLIG